MILVGDESGDAIEYAVSNFATTGDLTSDNIEMDAVGSPTYHTLQDFFNYQGAGRVSGGTLSSNGDGTLSIATGTGVLKTSAACVTDTVFVEWATITPLSLTDNSTNYIYIDYNVGSPTAFATTDRSTINMDTEITLGRAYRSGTTVYVVQSGANAYCLSTRTHERFVGTDGGMVRASGGVIAETGTRNISSTDGSFYLGLNNVTTTAKDTSGTDKFTYWYCDGSGGWTSAASQTQIDNTHYDDGDGTLGTLSNNEYGVHWAFISFDGSLHVLYGQSSYTLTNANNATLPSSLPALLSSFCTLAAKIIIKKDDTAFTSITSAYTTVFPVSSPSDHNDLGGLQGGTTDEYYHLTATEYTTTLPKYYGSLASEPATYKPGDYYFNTGDSKMKFYVASIGWKSFTPDA